MADSIEFSVVVPMRDEAGNAGALADEIAAAMEGRAYEVIFVDDDSRDDTRAVLAAARAKNPRVRIMAHRGNAGQSRAIATGVRAARGAVVGTLDGDGQNDPKDLPALFAKITREDAPADLALVQGVRLKRQDTWAKRIASKIANAVRSRMLGDGAVDSGCGIKVFKRDAYLTLPYFDHMHRYMPALMRREGFAVEFAEVHHRPRSAGRSKYTNLGRLLDALSDLNGVMWLRSRRRLTGGVDEL